MQESDIVKRARWAQYFDVEEFVTQQDSEFGHKLGRSMSSDGISLSIKMSYFFVIKFTQLCDLVSTIIIHNLEGNPTVLVEASTGPTLP